MLLAHVGMDNKDKTFAWLQKYYDARSPLTTHKADPMYDLPALRSALSEITARCPLGTIEFALPEGRLTVGATGDYQLTELVLIDALTEQMDFHECST
jgi:hypothetical protein